MSMTKAAAEDTRVELFTREEFETALPVSKNGGYPLWGPAGLIDSEYAYLIPIQIKGIPGYVLGIMVRSSVGPDGVSAGCGEDSIRCWIVGPDLLPWGSKVSRWTTRLPGWQSRLTRVLRTLWKWAARIRPCPVNPEHGLVAVYKVRKEGPTKGRVFLRCRDKECRFFEWIEEV